MTRLKARAVNYMQMVMCCLLMTVSFTLAAETAIATDAVEDAIIFKKVTEQQQATEKATSTASSVTIQRPQIANDLTEGETRTLPTLNSPIVDQANLLTPAQNQAISQSILKLHEEGKAQIGVVIVSTTGQEDIFDYAMRLAEQWKLGGAKQDNGLIMAIAVNDRRIQILTGYGLEGVLPDIVVGRIIREKITPYFKQAQYAEGIRAGVTEIERILNLDPEVAAQAAKALQERQEQALHEQQAKEKTYSAMIFILVAGIIGSFIVGNRLSAATAGVAAVTAGLVNGAGLVMSLLLGFGIFFLLFTSIAQLIFQAFLSGGGRGGGSGGGGFGGGGYSGGGGFGGGGASGSW